MIEERATPYVEVPAKRSADKVPVQFDWHDHLANQWQPGSTCEAGLCIRLPRMLATGLEYEVTTAGVTGARRPNFPGPVYDQNGNVEDTGIGRKVASGSVIFTARAITTSSLRATITLSEFPTVDGITLSDESENDLIYTVYAEGGTPGQQYEIVHRVTLSNPAGEKKEAVAALPVKY